MSYEHEQQEQLDHIRNWWKNSKKWAIPLLALLVVAFIGYNAYVYYKQQQQNQINELYHEFDAAMKSNPDVEKIVKNPNYVTLKTMFQDVYLAQAAVVQVATAALREEKYPLAIQELTTLSKMDNEKGAFVCNAKVHLAGAFLEQKKFTEAMNVLKLSDSQKENNEPICVAFTLERLGDIHFASKKPLEAKKQWELAQTFVKKHQTTTKDENHPLKTILDIKLQGF